MKKVKTAIGIIVLVTILFVNIHVAIDDKQLVGYSLQNVEALADSDAGVSITDCYKHFVYEVDRDLARYFATKCGVQSTFPLLDVCGIGYVFSFDPADFVTTNIGECVKV